MNLKEYTGYKKTVTVNDQIEMYKIIVRINSFIHGIPTSITQEAILAYCCAFGCSETSYKHILDLKIITNRQILYNNISQLVNWGLIIKTKRFREVCNNLKVETQTGISPYIIIKLNCKNIITLEQEI